MQIRSLLKAALPWVVVGLCVAAGLLTDIFRMSQAVAAGFIVVVLVLAYSLLPRVGRLAFSRKFPFIRLVLPSVDD